MIPLRDHSSVRLFFSDNDGRDIAHPEELLDTLLYYLYECIDHDALHTSRPVEL